MMNFEGCLAPYESTIQHIARRYAQIDSVDLTAFSREDFISILRASVWTLMQEYGPDTDANYICRALWNDAKSLIRKRTKHKLLAEALNTLEPFTQPTTLEPFIQPAPRYETQLDVQKMLDGVSTREAKILWMVAEYGNEYTCDHFHFSETALKRILRKARTQIRAAFPEYVQA